MFSMGSLGSNNSMGSSNEYERAALVMSETERALSLSKGSMPSSRLPDADCIKMFVGQIPRSMTEVDLRTMFQEFGEIYQINVLRDKRTTVSKGCCFITFFTRKAALAAQNILHNIKTLPGMYHPIQMKPADTDNKIGRKLFIGMLSKSCTEQDLRDMLSQFGEIEQCNILRDTDNRSKGCAFLTFTTKQMALSAIRRLNQSIIMEGCSLPLLVQLADTPKVKDEKKMFQETQELLSSANSNPLVALNQHYLSTLLQQSPHLPNSTSALNAAPPPAPSRLPYAPQPQTSHVSGISNGNSLQHLLQSSLGTSPHIYDTAGGGVMANGNGAMSVQDNLQSLLANFSSSQNSGLTVNMQNLAALAALASLNQQSPLQGLAQNGYGSALSDTSCLSGSTATISGTGLSSSGPSTKQIEGPPGANLFIYHLPQDFTDADLAQCFWPYGKVISAKVFIDKQTKLSKCFGFVSYDHPDEAQNAITAMNGHTVSNKRLKVQLKRPKDGRPY